MVKAYLVTGGAGFIGSNFIRYLFSCYGDKVFVVNLDKLTYASNINNIKEFNNNKNYKFVKGDVCNKKLVERLFEAYKFDYVVNFAAESDVDRSFVSDTKFVKTNVHGTLNLLECAKKFWTDCEKTKSNVKFVQVSTDEVYGSLSLNCGQFVETSPINPQNPYAVTKATADKLCLQFFKNFNFPVNITRCSNNYGPNQHPEKLVALTIFKCLNMQSVPIHGTGENIRDWIYVSDHCSAIDLVVKKGKSGEVYNIGANCEKTNLEIVNTVINTLKKYNNDISSKLITFVENRKVNDLRYSINFNKIKTELGWKPKIEFLTGIEKTVDWYVNNAEWFKTVNHDG